MNRPPSPEARRVSSLGLLGVALFAAALLVVLAPPAPADVIKPVVQLGPSTITNGVAAVSGTVAVPSSSVELTINGQPVAINVNGDFAATVDLGGRSNLSIGVRNPLTAETTTTTIPLTTNIVGPGGVLGPGVLAALEQAGVTILKPLGGFQIHEGLPLRVGGDVVNKETLASLRVNGMDVLGRTTGRGFTVQLPGSTREVVVTATDRQGVSQTTVLPVEQTARGGEQAPAAGAVPAVGRSVDAARAVGVRIARVRYQLKSVRRTKRLRVAVTVTDGRGLRVRGAAVGVRTARAGWIRRNPRAKRSDRLGRTSFVLTVRNRAFGRRLRLVVIAKTPRAKARKAAAVRLPPARRRAASRTQ